MWLEDQELEVVKDGLYVQHRETREKFHDILFLFDLIFE